VVADDESSMTVALAQGSLWWVQSQTATTEVRVEFAGDTASSIGARAMAGCDISGCFVGDIDGQVQLAGATGSPVELAALQFSAVSAAGMSAPKPFPPSALRAIDFAAINVQLDLQAGLRPTPSDADPVDSPTAAQLDGKYSITYRTTQSDAEDVSAATGVVRAATIRTDCVQLVCTVVLGTEAKNSDGSTVVLDSPLTYDGTTYRGALSSSAPCTNYQTNDVADAGIAYTASIVLVINSAINVDGTPTVSGFEITLDETNVVTDAGRAVDCRINFLNDPYSVHSVVVGDGTRS
jgi:hypothetical protein